MLGIDHGDRRSCHGPTCRKMHFLLLGSGTNCGSHDVVRQDYPPDIGLMPIHTHSSPILTIRHVQDEPSKGGFWLSNQPA